MRTLAALVVALGLNLLGGGPLAADEPAPAAKPAAPPVRPTPGILTLREAVAQGRLEAEGFGPSSYTRVHLRMRNRTPEPLHVDICGSYLVPRRSGSCQRLGLGPVVTPRGSRTAAPRGPREDAPPGTVIVVLEAHEESVVEVNTCCLDAGKPSPDRQTFKVSASRLPPVRETVLRWWADHPDAPQGAVNSAIWQFRDTVVVPSGAQAAMMKTGVAAHAGTLYMLRQGELLTRDPDGIERFLGTEIHAVHPTDSAVYAEALGAARGPRSRRTRELWRLVPTGDEPWKLVAPIPTDLRLDRIHVAPSGAVLFTTSEGLYRVDVRAGRFERVLETQDRANLSLRFERGGTALVTLRRPSTEGYYQGGERKGERMPVCELWRVNLEKGSKERLRELWNIGQIQAGVAGLYALTPAGKLRRMVGRSFHNAPGRHDYERILAVGRTCVWLESRDGRLVASDAGGRLRFRSGPRVDTLLDWHRDPHDDAVVYLSRGQWIRLDPESGKRTTLEARQAPPDPDAPGER